MWPELERHLAGFFESLMSVGTFSPLASKEQSLLTSLAAPQSSREESGVRRKIRVNFGLRCGWSTLTHCSKARRRTGERISRRQGQGTWVDEDENGRRQCGMVEWTLIAECTIGDWCFEYFSAIIIKVFLFDCTTVCV
jgi:hypothetical protein